MAQATGIGGVFFRSDDPGALGAWYHTHLGIDMSAGAWMQAAGPTVFAPFARDTDYFPADRQTMLNFRVDDLAALIAALEAAGIDVETRTDWDTEIGCFARIHDPEGNPVELWEPQVQPLSDRMDVRAILMGLAFAFMWSSAFTSARIIVADASPLYSLAFRFLLSGILGVGIALAIGQSWRLTRQQWYLTILFGICQNALYLGLYFVAMQTVEAGLAAIFASTMPLLVAAATWALFGQTLRPLGVIGLTAGFVGVALIMGSRIGAGVDLYGLMLCGFGVLALTFATLAVRGATSGGNFMMIVGLQMLVGAFALFVAAMIFETPRFNPTWPLAAAFLYTTLVPGLLATYVWFRLLDRLGPIRAATFHFLNPVFGVAVAAVLLGERLSRLDVVGVAIVTAGILAVQLSRQRS